jgi:tetratricopeptide (TPR) repeat protein
MQSFNKVRTHFLLWFLALSGTSPWVWCEESALDQAIRKINHDWSEASYATPKEQRSEKFARLLKDTHRLIDKYPKKAEPLIMEGLLLSSLAGLKQSLSSLSDIWDAEDRLKRALALDANPGTLGASAQITLAALYDCASHENQAYRVIMGDTANKANEVQPLFEQALKLQPNDLAVNFYVGLFWLGRSDFNQAVHYLEKANLSDEFKGDDIEKEYLQKEIASALKMAKAHQPGKTYCQSS